MSATCSVDLVVVSSDSQYPGEGANEETLLTVTEDVSASVEQFFHLYVNLPTVTSRELVPATIRTSLRFLLVRNLHSIDSVDLTYYTAAQAHPTTSKVRIMPGQIAYLTDLTGNTNPTVIAARATVDGTDAFNLEVMGGGI